MGSPVKPATGRQVYDPRDIETKSNPPHSDLVSLPVV